MDGIHTSPFSAELLTPDDVRASSLLGRTTAGESPLTIPWSSEAS